MNSGLSETLSERLIQNVKWPIVGWKPDDITRINLQFWYLFMWSYPYVRLWRTYWWKYLYPIQRFFKLNMAGGAIMHFHDNWFWHITPWWLSLSWAVYQLKFSVLGVLLPKFRGTSLIVQTAKRHILAWNDNMVVGAGRTRGVVASSIYVSAFPIGENLKILGSPALPSDVAEKPLWQFITTLNSRKHSVV